jgi:hypothetical protein
LDGILFIYVFTNYLTSLSLTQAQQPKNSHTNKCVSSCELCNGNAKATGVAYFEIISQHNHRGNKKINEIPLDIQRPGIALKPKPNNEYTASLLGELTFILSEIN